MQIDLGKAKELFLAVLEMPAQQRATYLETACAGDTLLRQRIEAMLRTHENSGELLPRSPAEMLADGGTEADATAAFQQQPDSPPTLAEPETPDADLTFLSPSSTAGHLGRLGHYEIQAIIGKGGFGTVFKAFDPRLHRVVAIKVLSPVYAANGSARKRFIREAQAVAAVKNEHVVGIYDVEKDSQPPYFVMELIDGVSLQDKLDKHGALGVKEILRIGMQIAEGLAAAHKQGKVHRDIKPANILLENGVERVKITDFGLARAVDDASVTQSGTVAGTPMYMSPEQAEGLPIDHRSDLFSLGTVLYAMCTGHPPFRASGTHAVLKRVIDASPRPIREINDEISEWLCDIITKLHAKKPEDRFQTAKEVAELLGQHLAHEQQPLTVERPASVLSASEGCTLSPQEVSAQHEKVGAGILRFLAVAPWVAILAGAAMLVLAPSLGPERFDAIRFLAVLFVIFGILGLVVFRAIRQVEKEPTGPAEAGEPSPSIPRPVATAANASGSLSPAKRGLPRALRWLGSGAAIVAAVILGLWVIPNWLRGSGTIELQSNNAEVQVIVAAQDGSSTRTLTGNGDIELPAGFYYVEARCGSEHLIDLISITDWEFKKRTFPDGVDKDKLSLRVEKGQRTFIDVRVKPREARAEPGWVQLFNGKDLTGWITPEPGPDNIPEWRVDKGLGLRASGLGRQPSCLVTERDDFANFHLHAEVSMNPKTSSSIFFRCGREFKFFPAGYEVVIAENPPDYRTGTLGLTTAANDKHSILFRVLESQAPMNNPVAIDPKASTVVAPSLKYFRMDVIARGNHMVVKIDGKSVADCTDSSAAYKKGRIALWNQGSDSAIFKKIEIKELPPSEPGWVQLFNGKDLTEWQGLRSETALAWRIENDELVGQSKPSYKGGIHLKTVREFGSEFHLRMEVKANDGPGFPLVVFAGGQPQGFRVHLNSNEKLGLTTGTAILYNKNFVLNRAPGGLVKSGGWYRLEIICYRNRFTMRLNGKPLGDHAVPGGLQKRGTIGLSCAGDSSVRFRNIEIKEGPPEEFGLVKLPDTAEQVLPALAGAWKGEYTQKIYGGKADVKKISAIAVNDWIVGQKWLRQRVQLDNEAFQSVTTYEPGPKVFRDWFFHSRGLIFGPSTGRWDSATRTLTWTNLPEAGVILLMTLRFVDADTFAGEILIRDKDGKTVFEMSSLMKRTTENVSIDKNIAAGPLPKEMAVLDRIVGDWQTTAFIKNAKNPDGFKSTWHSTSRKILGGRVIDTERTGDTGDDESYSLATFDTFSKAYGRWSFRANGNVMEYHGLWDEENQTLQWHWAGKDGSQSSNTWPLRDPNRRDWQVVTKNALGKTTFEVQATSVRQSVQGWVQLFNGKNLAGWRQGIPNQWKVEKGVLIGAREQLDNGVLQSEQVFQNFHCRLDVKVNAGGDAVFGFRAAPDNFVETNLVSKNDLRGFGSLTHRWDSKAADLVKSTKKLTDDDNWVTLDVIAQGKKATVKVNGTTTAEKVIDEMLDRGYFDFGLGQVGSMLQIRKIEIKELPPK